MSSFPPASPMLRRLQPKFVGQVRNLGAHLQRSGRVELLEATDDLVVAQVEAHDLIYRVTVDDPLDGLRRRLRCTCRPVSPDARCLHVWATLLAVQELLAGGDEAAAVGEDHNGAAAAPARAAGPRLLAAERAPAAGPRPDWQRRLQRLVDRREALLPSAPVVLEYHVELVTRESAAAMMVAVYQRKRRQAGELGARRGGWLSPMVCELLPRADRDLLELFVRDAGIGSFANDAWGELGDVDVSLAQPWFVRSIDLPVVLPLLAATGRVYAHGAQPVDGSTELQPLQIDLGEPFCFEVMVTELGSSAASAAADPAAAMVELRGGFRRGEQWLTLGKGPVRDRGLTRVGDRLVRVDCHGASELVRELAQEPIQVERRDVPTVLSTLAGIPGADGFLDSTLARLPVAEPQPVIALRFPKFREAPLQAELRFDYGGEVIGAHTRQPLVSHEDDLRARDRDGEARFAARARAAGLVATPDGLLTCPRDQLGAVVRALQDDGFRVLAEGRQLRAFASGSGKVRTGIDWLEVGVEVAFDGYSAALPELLRRRQNVDGFVELDDGSLGMLPEAWLQKLESLRALGAQVEGDVVRLPTSQSLLLDAMLAARTQDDFAVDRKFAARRKQLAACELPMPLAESPKFVGELRGYQREGLGWLAFLRRLGLGGCLADDMGLGKTVQVLAMLAGLPRKRGSRPSLIVAPRSVLGNWLEECARFAPGLRVLDFSGADRWRRHGKKGLADCDLVLTTYALVRADAPKFVQHQVAFRYAILDEAQAIKNPGSQSSKAVRLLSAEHRLALTGTPVENHLGELWSLFEFLNPGMLGRLPAFQAMFGKDAKADELRANGELVRRTLRPVLLRRTKAQVLQDLPAKTEQTLWCELDPKQRRRYDELRRHYRERLLRPTELDGQQRFMVLEALLRLRQAACHEKLLDRRLRSATSAKFEELLPRLEELTAEGHKALVFSQFTGLLDLLEVELRQRSLTWERIDGKTKKRAERVERFQTDPACPLFLISLKAGGVGLNLTAASYVFLLDPWWNPAAEAQAVDRAHRIGQQRAVHAYRLVCRDTVEERVLELQADKKALCDAILGNERSLLQDLTREDLEALLR